MTGSKSGTGSRARVVWVGLVLLWGYSLLAGDVEAQFQAANRAYAEGRFADAAHGYEAILAQEGFSSEVLFNLGNAYWQQGRVGLAVLNYERARWLAPRDPDVAANLSLVRQEAGLTREPASWYRRWSEGLSADAWAWVGSSALLVICVAIFFSRVIKRYRAGFLALKAVAALTMLAAAAALLFVRAKLPEAVVVMAAPVRVSPVPAAKTNAELQEGELVKVERVHGEYLRVQRGDRTLGWILGSAVQPVVTARAFNQ